jgi:glucokinase
VRVENDANVAAQGELWLGAARGERHALVVTLGTGIGGGVVLDGRLFVGEGLAGEIGHVTVDACGPQCGCGARGCLETLASASAASRRARERGLPAAAPGDLELLATRARAAAGPERELLLEVGLDLGRGLASAVSLLDLRTFVLGGGFSAALDLLEPGIRRGLAERAYGERVASVRLVRALLGPSAGWIGAACLCRPAAGRTPPRAARAT